MFCRAAPRSPGSSLRPLAGLCGRQGTPPAAMARLQRTSLPRPVEDMRQRITDFSVWLKGQPSKLECDSTDSAITEALATVQFISVPPHMVNVMWVADQKFGESEPSMDSNGLQTWRGLFGTNNNEALHSCVQEWTPQNASMELGTAGVIEASAINNSKARRRAGVEKDYKHFAPWTIERSNELCASLTGTAPFAFVGPPKLTAAPAHDFLRPLTGRLKEGFDEGLREALLAGASASASSSASASASASAAKKAFHEGPREALLDRASSSPALASASAASVTVTAASPLSKRPRVDEAEAGSSAAASLSALGATELVTTTVPATATSSSSTTSWRSATPRPYSTATKRHMPQGQAQPPQQRPRSNGSGIVSGMPLMPEPPSQPFGSLHPLFLGGLSPRPPRPVKDSPWLCTCGVEERMAGRPGTRNHQQKCAKVQWSLGISPYASDSPPPGQQDTRRGKGKKSKSKSKDLW